MHTILALEEKKKKDMENEIKKSLQDVQRLTNSSPLDVCIL